MYGSTALIITLNLNLGEVSFVLSKSKSCSVKNILFYLLLTSQQQIKQNIKHCTKKLNTAQNNFYDRFSAILIKHCTKNFTPFFG